MARLVHKLANRVLLAAACPSPASHFVYSHTGARGDTYDMHYVQLGGPIKTRLFFSRWAAGCMLPWG